MMPADASRPANPVYTPLADRMRPKALDDFIGQQHILGQDDHKGSALRQAIETGTLHSMVFWGPPGTGKTTLALAVAASTDRAFE
ncbi:MAG: AAA family ATPase, partial [Gammaproteobacteria bacterium]